VAVASVRTAVAVALVSVVPVLAGAVWKAVAESGEESGKASGWPCA
jgi:hypothetical protein